MPSNKFPEVQFWSIESCTFKCIEELTSKSIQSKGCWMSATRFEVLSWLEIYSGTPEIPRGSSGVIGKIFMGLTALKYGKLSIYKQAQKLVLIDALDLQLLTFCKSSQSWQFTFWYIQNSMRSLEIPVNLLRSPEIS